MTPVLIPAIPILMNYFLNLENELGHRMEQMLLHMMDERILVNTLLAMIKKFDLRTHWL